MKLFAMLMAAASVVALVAIMQVRRRKAEAEFRELFKSGAEFIGKDIRFMASKVGYRRFEFGSMDHGQEVAQWRGGNLIAEAWFQSGVCISVEVRTAQR